MVDASAVAELLLGTPAAERVAARVGEEHLIAPAHLPAEVTSVVRGWSLGGHLSDVEARVALREYTELGVDLVPLEELMTAAWELRHNLSAYDALYVALAEVSDAPLVTLDQRLAAAAPHIASVP
ncbi:type II toxin-antitoxin system VapC family toxin [Kytococcus sedentarius]|uniref:type II toxin-antitoxin system VapC family toxin n=1 Tax=Kytococcus sedentarius TaxID=1276 RepID=UPI0035BB9F63